MSHHASSIRRALPRRGFLGIALLGPAALAACSRGHAAAAPRAGASEATASPLRRASAERADAAVAAVRAFPLPASAEPAVVFRAAAARPGEPR